MARYRRKSPIQLSAARHRTAGLLGNRTNFACLLGQLVLQMSCSDGQFDSVDTLVTDSEQIDGVDLGLLPDVAPHCCSDFQPIASPALAPPESMILAWIKTTCPMVPKEHLWSVEGPGEPKINPAPLFPNIMFVAWLPGRYTVCVAFGQEPAKCPKRCTDVVVK